MYFNASFWHNHFRSTLFVELANLVKVLHESILPQLSNISAEAADIQNQTWSGLTSSLTSGDYDPSDFMDAAFNAGYKHYSLMSGLNQGVVNLFAASLFHIHEQHIMLFYKRELRDPLRVQNDPKKLKPFHVVAHLEKLGVHIKSLPSWGQLKEIEQLANAIKHGEGEAAQALRKARPNFFIDPQLSSDPDIGPSLHLGKPLLGEGIYVTTTHLQEIERVIVAFWDELFEVLKQHEHKP
ncbi:hypothetical protein [Aquariibacter albus]|uniref:Uncharacterized protein n=1 Tax=Aquariibacter albus TaxID=2759899 RepID=A0A839HT42_9BURK|nr:hypothetical protein [Aquariibacter albus]MBB1161054.1 hypothetical protein [Aquariibacter albus]